MISASGASLPVPAESAMLSFQCGYGYVVKFKMLTIYSALSGGAVRLILDLQAIRWNICCNASISVYNAAKLL